MQVRGTDGNSGGIWLGKKGVSVGKSGIKYYCLKVLDRVWVCFDFGFFNRNGYRVRKWIRLLFMGLFGLWLFKIISGPEFEFLDLY